MQIIHGIAQMREMLAAQRRADAKIGFVPTMGALHEGHLRLIRQSVAENTLTVCSIFVNPIQFNNLRDFILYPRTVEEDSKKALSAGCNVLFVPSADEMYPQKSTVGISFGDAEKVMEGAFRPGHFSGVGVVVAKLFNIVQPDVAYFGQKDFQQCAVVEMLVRDLSFPVRIVKAQTVRESDGLAMSSRNARLTKQQRAVAPVIYSALKEAEKMMKEGISFEKARISIAERIAKEPLLSLEYCQTAKADTLEIADEKDENTTSYALCVAVFADKVRLIDNIIVEF
jgi:pantoate--beta-alanine ligase